MLGQTTSSQVQPVSLSARPSLRNRGWLREAIETALLIVAIYALVNLVTARYVVDGASMRPNFATGQYVIVSRLNYLFGEPQAGDIVVFHYPNDPADDYIKRVIGVPGDTVEIVNGAVIVNGTALSEPYIFEANCSRRCDSSESWVLAADEYFVMGDNRNNSQDSRVFGPVKRNLIVGEALFRYWPLNQIGVVKDIGY